MDSRSTSNRIALLGISILPLALSGCGGGGDDDDEAPFTVFTTHESSAATTRVVFSGTNFAFLASEATKGAGGTDLNGDGDMIDSGVILVDVTSKAETNLGVAADEIAWVQGHLYVVVDESEDVQDWDGDGDTGADDLSLLHWTTGMADPVFVAALEGVGPAVIVAASDRLFFVEQPTAAPGIGLTSLQQIEIAAPELPLPLSTSSDAANGLQPRLLGIDEGLVFAYASELVDGVDLNGDLDLTDGFVLLLIDGTIANPIVDLTGLGLRDEDTAFRANARAAGDWLVAVLVNEAAHSGTNPPPGGVFTGFNDPDLFDSTWQPPQCSSHQDTDIDDDVLFWIDYADWRTDPVGSPPQNTGLVGTTRVIALENHVATVSLESDDDGCDLNEDGDDGDRVVRWVETSIPVLPAVDSAVDILALADEDDIPGGTAGLAELAGRMVILADEQADGSDLDLSDDDNRLLGWRDPDSSTSWTFNHGTIVSGAFVDFFGGASWMAESPDRTRLLAAVPEDVEDVNLNTLGTDTDTNDSVPTFLVFNAAPRLVFPFVRFAAEADDAGMVLAAGLGFYRISESADSKDWNGDGDLSDHVLFRTALDTGTTSYMGVASNVSRPVVDLDPATGAPAGAGLVSSESSAGSDINGDGDSSDFVVRWFKF